MREILKRVMKYEWFGCNTEARKGLDKELDQALAQLKSELLGKIDTTFKDFELMDKDQVKQVIEEEFK